MEKFKIDDEVVCIKDFSYNSVSEGKVGIVENTDYDCTLIDDISLEIFVLFDGVGRTWIDKDFIALREDRIIQKSSKPILAASLLVLV